MKKTIWTTEEIIRENFFNFLKDAFPKDNKKQWLPLETVREAIEETLQLETKLKRLILKKLNLKPNEVK